MWCPPYAATAFRQTSSSTAISSSTALWLKRPSGQAKTVRLRLRSLDVLHGANTAFDQHALQFSQV